MGRYRASPVAVTFGTIEAMNRLVKKINAAGALQELS
jgi:hypothetical protein